MNEKIGIFGAGNMGKALIYGLIQSKLYKLDNIIVYDINQEMLDKVHETLKVSVAPDEKSVVREADLIVLAVKPDAQPSLLNKIKSQLNEDHVLISIAPGITISQIESLLLIPAKIVRVMPNTPALVGEGMSGLVANQNVEESEKEKVKTIFSSFGKAEFVPESLMDAVVGLSGSGPAYVYMFIEAMADGAVQQGMPRNMAYQFAAQTVLGSAKMVMETGKHPGELKDMVCSPGGTTIEGVKSLEEDHFRATVMNAVIAGSKKSRSM